MNAWMSARVAGMEKFWIGVLAAVQTYMGAVDWLSEPEKALVVALLGVAQVWLGTNSPQTPKA